MQDSIKKNIDPTEQDKFNAYAEQWWDRDSKLWTLHAINPLRLKFILQHTALQNKTVLDIGCGGGILTESMARHGAQVYGIDISKELIDTASHHARQSSLEINYEVNTVENFAQRSAKKFDVITCMELLEHVPDPVSIVTTCHNLCKPGGHVFFSTLNRNPKSFLYAILATEYVMKLLPVHTHEYEKFIRPSELASWCRQAGLRIDQFMGIAYIPFIKKFYLARSIDVNYLAHATLS